MTDSTATPNDKKATPDMERCPVNHNSSTAATNTTYDQGDDQGPTIHSENIDHAHAPQRPSMGGCPVMHHHFLCRH